MTSCSIAKIEKCRYFIDVEGKPSIPNISGHFGNVRKVFISRVYFPKYFSLSAENDRLKTLQRMVL